MQKKLILFLGLLFIFFGGVSYCAEEQITLTTFYPAPYGVYSVLRFFPRTQPATSNEGDVYYDLTGRILRYYDGSAWVDIGEPRGTIILWSGSVANIPSGWALCDGLTHSGITTPNLMDRFVVGAGSSYPVNGTGGSASITLGLNELPSHTHTQATGSTNSAGDHTHGYNDKSHSTNTNDINGAGFFGMVRSLSDVDTSRTTLSTGAHSHSVNVTLNNAGSGQAFDSRPPYYALCYIMKL